MYTVYTYDMQHIHYITNHPIWDTLFSNKPNHWQPNLWGTLPISSTEPPVDQCLKLWLDVLKQKMQPSIYAIPMQNDVRVCAHIVCIYIYKYKLYTTLHYITLCYVTLHYTRTYKIQSQNKYTHLFMLHYTYTYMHTIGVAQSIVLEHHPSIVSSEILSMQNPNHHHPPPPHHHHWIWHVSDDSIQQVQHRKKQKKYIINIYI